MRPEIETLLKAFETPSDETPALLDKLAALAATPAEHREIGDRLNDIGEAQRIEGERLTREADDFESAMAPFMEWAEAEAAKGRMEAELTYGVFLRETGRQEEIDADDRWLKGPHCPEDQIYLDAMDACAQPNGVPKTVLIADMVSRMDQTFGADEPTKIAAAERILKRWVA